MIDHKVMGMIANWVICTVGGIVVIATLYIWATYSIANIVSQLGNPCKIIVLVYLITIV